VNVLLVQPPDPPKPVQCYEPPPGDTELFSPPWNLLCLRTYLLEHTRHVCTFLDCRFYKDLETELIQAIELVPEPEIACVNTTSVGLGQASAVLEVIKRRFPKTRTAICGQHPSQYPEHAGSVPRADFSLCGDPETILRNLIEYIDVDQRLRRVPGLLFGGAKAVPPYWLPDLKSLSLPDWQGVFWRGYSVGREGVTSRVLARISRGQTRLPADRASGEAYEPIRFWPLDRVAMALQKCGATGVTEVFLHDPPGIWTVERLDEWCKALDRVRNVQPWAFQLLPTNLSARTIELLSVTICRRIEFLFPSCDPEVLRQYGCVITPRDLSAVMGRIEKAGIEVHSRFWLRGPEERLGERRRVAATIRALSFRKYSLHPFPFLLDAPIYQNFIKAVATHVEDWVEWSRDPWLIERPLAVWGGPTTAEGLPDEMDWIINAVKRHPRRVAREVLQALKPRNLISTLENKALGLLSRPEPPSGFK